MQESFQLTHETLYLSVELTDLYMSKKDVKREDMQLLGATAILLASKFYVSFKKSLKHEVRLNSGVSYFLKLFFEELFFSGALPTVP